jgi:hypothetical protein
VRILVLLLTMIFSFEAKAFDPFTVGMATKGITDIVGFATDLGSVADAFTELYSEVDSEAKISEEGQKMVDEIAEIDSLAREAGYTAEDINEIGAPSVDEAKKLENYIRSVTKAVKATKRMKNLFKRLEAKAHSAQIESTQIEKEQLAQLYKIAREEQAQSLADVKKELRSQIDRKNLINGLKKTVKEKGARWFKASGALAFPKAKAIIETSITVSQKLRMPLMGLMLAVFLARLIYYQIGFHSTKSHGDLVRDIVVCSFLLLVYPDLVRAILSFAFSVSESVIINSTSDIDSNRIAFKKMDGVSTGFGIAVWFTLETLKYCTYFIVDFLCNFGIGFMVMVFPVVIFFSQMMNFSVAWPIFLAGFATLALWPLFWNLVGISAEMVWSNRNYGLVDSFYSTMLSLIQLISPMIGFKLLKGAGVKDSIQSSASTVANGVSGVASVASGIYTGGSTAMAKAGSIIGSKMMNSDPSQGRSMGAQYSADSYEKLNSKPSDYSSLLRNMLNK